jgi:hypothetical protein
MDAATKKQQENVNKKHRGSGNQGTAGKWQRRNTREITNKEHQGSSSLRTVDKWYPRNSTKEATKGQYGNGSQGTSLKRHTLIIREMTIMDGGKSGGKE